MDARQQAARDEAIALWCALESVGSQTPRDQRQIEKIVDRIIAAATPGLSPHAESVAQQMASQHAQTSET